MRAVMIVALVLVGGCDTKSMPSPVYDLAYNPFFDLSFDPNAPTAPTCNPPMGGMPMSLTCPGGSTFYSSANGCGCFPTGSPPANANPDPGYDKSSCNGDLVVQCNPGCSFCVKSCSPLPPGCHICDMNNPC